MNTFLGNAKKYGTLKRRKIQYLCTMAKKGKEKNTKNKAKHSKLMNRKKNKLKEEQASRKAKLKAIIEQKNTAQ